MKQAILYTRVSTKEQGTERNGLEAQLKALHTFCEGQGITPLLHLEEVASGGLGFEGRPLLAKAFSLAKKLGACVLVSKLDRLSREVQLISTLMNGKTEFYTVEDGLDCPPLMLHMKAVIAEHERKLISERTKAGLASVKARGKALGLHAHKAEGSEERFRAGSKAALQAKSKAFAMKVKPTVSILLQSGMSYADIAKALNSSQVPTANGGQWHASTVCNVIKHYR